MRINPESELAIQSAFVSWLDLHAPKYPELALFYAVPNAAKRGKMDGWLMRCSGTRKGVPDMHLPCRGMIDNKTYIGLFIEFKSAKGVLRPEQAAWCNALRSQGHFVRVCRSWTDAANIVIEYLDLSIKHL